MNERRFRRHLDALDEVLQFVSEYLAESGAPEDKAFDIQLIVDELFTNLVKYNLGSEQDIALGLEKRGDRLIISLTDFDVEGFDVTRAPPVDITQPAPERKVGGLGLHFVRALSEHIDYQYENRVSRITVTTRLER